MALYPISLEKENQLLERMRALGVREQDLDEQFVRSSGAGGQNVNKVSSCVLLYHRPSGLRVRCQKERSQALNRYLARRLLLDKLEASIRGQAQDQAARSAKIRRQKHRRSRRAKEKLLADKRRRSETKSRRAPVRGED